MHTQKRKIQTSISNDCGCKGLQQKLTNQIEQHIKRIIHHNREIVLGQVGSHIQKNKVEPFLHTIYKN